MIGIEHRSSVLLRVGCALSCAAACALGQSVDWPTLGITQVVTNDFSFPTSITHAGDGSQRLFVEEKAGWVWIIQNNSVGAQPFLVITNRVLSSGAEQGLLGLAFPPGFATNSHFYVNYTRLPDGATVISRFSLTANPNIANANSEQILLVIPRPYDHHNGGQIAFGPDGKFYVGTGDGGTIGTEGDPHNNGQYPGSLLGKLLRIDVQGAFSPYSVPTDNPFVGNTNYAPEIWALGLRNPWRFSFDRLTGDLYIGDVGHYRFEEIDFQPAGSPGGQNYGWRIMEGVTNYNGPVDFTNFSSLTSPVAWYHHASLPTGPAASVTGGYVYRGPDEPRMNGIYFFGDFVSGWLWGLKRIGTNWQRFELLSPVSPSPHYSISTFGEDEHGRLYFADYYAGKIYQLQDSRQVWTPIFSPTNGFAASNGVMISCATTGAVIHYTTNGIDPTESDPVVPPSGIIGISDGGINKARAFRPDLAPSAVATAVFAFKVGTPIFTPPAGPIVSNTLVAVSTVTPDALIYYTTNGATPTSGSLLYSAPFPLSGTATIRAIGVANGFNDSAVATATYSPAQVAAPAFTPSSGPITNSTTISISCSTTGAVIYYTVDGTTPTITSLVYSNPFTINGGVTVSAMGMADGYLKSLVTTVFYSLVQTETPTFNPSVGPITDGTTLSMSCATPGAVIHYTLDGTTPTTNSAVYSGPFTINGGIIVSAIATASEHLDSALQSVFLTLTDYKYPAFTVTVAGNGQPGSSNGVGTAAQFASPQGICIDPAGNLFVTDTANHRIRKISPERVVTTLAGTGQSGFEDGPALSALFSSPVGICVDPGGNLYIADSANNRIRKLDAAGNVTTFAGNGAEGYLDGPAATAKFRNLRFLKCDAQTNLYVGDWARVRKVAPNGAVTTLAGSGVNSIYGFSGDIGLCVDASNVVYAASEWGRIFQITPAGVQTLFAGNSGGYNDGPRLNALFSSHLNFIGRDLAVDQLENIFVSDNSQVRKIDPSGWVSTLAGSTVAGFSDGAGALAHFSNETGLCVDNHGNIYVADTGSHAIRKISAGPLTPPSLQILLSNGRAVLSWPLWASTYVLETSTTASLNASWTPLTNGVIMSSNGFHFTNNVFSSAAFYRLRQQ
jgi:glucose/arabinose dehydrogenase